MSKKVKEVMTKNPIYIGENALAVKALNIMNKKKITTLLISKEENSGMKNKKFKIKGIVHIHSLLAKGIK